MKFKLHYLAILFGSVLIASQSVIPVSADIGDSDNYYNVLLDDESAVRFRRSKSSVQKKSADLHFNAKNTIEDVLNYPGFKPFAKILMPNTKQSDLAVHLDELQNIMSIHHNITTDNTLESLDYLASRIENKERVFYPIYSKEDIKADPTLEDTGLYFFRGDENAPFAIILPGGYSYRSTIHEGLPIALRVSNAGFNAFVLSYRSGNLIKGSKDLITAINFVRNNADKLKVRKDKYSLWGAAVGAQLIINVTQNSEKGELKGLLQEKPAANIFSYPLSYYPSENDVPTVIVVGDQDRIVNKTILKSSINNLNKMGIESKFILIPRLQHGFGVGFDPNSSVSINWIGRATSFWEEVAGLSEESSDSKEEGKEDEDDGLIM
ncbi:alpha/beta hydrolase [Succinivibrio dextrinosolvens]|jgi:acetyl esterase/lipase|uniref:alpha/beta hydrolase n=1 Tax=Succinivibrio dextrinosolvens TaxID=83771 RepID=UPI0012DF6B60|nr:hypothetical protein [Succinivibrio dextrinosolvens]MBE6424129.1 hypothetical protein [Succinivibrio dextrinosolvens]